MISRSGTQMMPPAICGPLDQFVQLLFLAPPFCRNPSNAGMDYAVALMNCSGSDRPFLARLFPMSPSGMGKEFTCKCVIKLTLKVWTGC